MEAGVLVADVLMGVVRVLVVGASLWRVRKYREKERVKGKCREM